MANILLTFYQVVIGNDPENLCCYYESITNELKKNGNNVLLINIIGYNSADIKQSTEKVKSFNPDVIFAFNNRLFEEYISATNCPILLFEADGVCFLVNRDLRRKYADRYYMVTNFACWINDYKKIGFSEDRIINIHPATSVQSEKLQKDKNIAFIGSRFPVNAPKIDQFLPNDTNHKIYSYLKKYWLEEDLNHEDLFSEVTNKYAFNIAELFALFDNRNYILTSLLDLGLSLYGVDWDKAESIALRAAFIREAKYSLKHNQNIYNTSIINLSISHPQTMGSAFPWRIYDIMASDGVLVTAKATYLDELTKGEVTIPTYNSPYDARDLCKKLLYEENLRNEIITQSNSFIEKHGRWESNFKLISEYVNINLLNSENEKCHSEYIYHKEQSLPIPGVQSPTASKNISIKNKIRYKLWKHLNKKLKKKAIIP